MQNGVLTHALLEGRLSPFHLVANLFLLAAAHGFAQLLGRIRLRTRQIARRLLHVFLELVVLVQHFLFVLHQLLSHSGIRTTALEVLFQLVLKILLLRCQLFSLVCDIPKLRPVLLGTHGLQRLTSLLQSLRCLLRFTLRLSVLLALLACRSRITHIASSLLQFFDGPLQLLRIHRLLPRLRLGRLT